VLERALIVSRGPRLTVDDLPDLAAAFATVGEEDATDAPPAPPADARGPSLRDRLATYERDILEDALRRSKGNQTEAARALRISRATLQYRLRRYGL
jgi:DNA-binding NtrC family response regulator